VIVLFRLNLSPFGRDRSWFCVLAFGLALAGCTSSHEGGVATKDQLKQTSNLDVWELKVGVVLNDQSTWPDNVIYKCTAKLCRDFRTPYGIYKINDPRSDHALRRDIENLTPWDHSQPSAVYYESRQNILSSLDVLKTDMLRAGCARTIDAFCRSNHRLSFERNCGAKFNFGKSELSVCENEQKPEPPVSSFSFQPLLEITACKGNNNEVRETLYLQNFKGSTSDALEAVFDTECLDWQSSP